MTDVSGAFQGLTTPIAELIDDIHRRGWTLNKVHVKDGEYVAVAKSPHKESLEATGRTEATAIGNVLVKVMRREHMRSSAIRQKLGAWDAYPIEQQLNQIAQAYASAPVYEPKAAPAWMDLAQDCARRAQIIRMQIAVEYTDDPTPYESADEMREDVTKKRHIQISRAYAHHPVWSEQQMLDYRLFVDVLGHAATVGDWGWHGTVLAFATLAPQLAESAQKALFTELLGQGAFGSFYRSWGPQKICFLEELIQKEQDKENKPGHHPVHPSQSIVPTSIPSIFSRVSAQTRTQLLKHKQELESQWPDRSRVVHEFPDGWTVRRPTTFGDMHRTGELMGNCWSLKNIFEGNPTGPYDDHPDWPWGEHDGRRYPADILSQDSYERMLAHLNIPKPNTGARALHDPHGLPRVVWHDDEDNGIVAAPTGRHNTDVKPAYQPYLDHYAQTNGMTVGGNVYGGGYQDDTDWEERTARVASAIDPNTDWKSGVSPLQDNAYLWQRQDGVDPLDAQGVSDSLHPLESGIANMHPELMKQSVINALRGSLLGTRSNARGHAIHYQDLQHLPASVDDPIAFWDALEQRREQHNQAQGYAPHSHKQHWPEEQQFKQWVKAANPHLDDADVQREAKRELLHMLSEEEERILASDQAEQLPAEVVEHEAYEALRRRLKALTKPTVDQKVDFGDHHLYHEAAAPQVMYHVAPAVAEHDIQENGLDYGRSPYASYAEEVGDPGGNYLWPTMPEADPQSSSAMLPVYHPADEHVWAVDVSGLSPKRGGRYSDPMNDTYYVTEPLGPERLTRVAKTSTHHEASDHLQWTPGQPGKGSINRKLEVKTWPVDDRGQPSHANGTWPYNSPEEFGSMRHFEITPEGEVLPVHYQQPGYRSNPYAEDSLDIPLDIARGAINPRTSTHHADMYPPYLTSRMRPLAQLGRHADDLSEAARQDLLLHGGKGHHFRAQALNLGIPGLGPRQVSNAWLHLAPQTSQLGIVNPETAEILGHNYATDTTNRDYFKHERELTAGRDASGYGHVPLGAFSTGLWDQYAGGPGWHPDRTPLKAYAPTPHHTIDWDAQTPPMTGWTSPYWWESTQEARDGTAQDFERSVATQFPSDEVPFQKTAMAERSGFPDLDQAIEEFMQANPEVQELRDPQNAWGRCQEIAEQCADFLKQRGFKAYAPSDELGAFEGYHDAQDSAAIGAGDFSYPEHAVVEVYGMYGPNNVNNVFIDFTASQYGYTEFPKVHGSPSDQETPQAQPSQPEHFSAVEGRSPWVTNPSTGERLTGAPGTSLMTHIKQSLGHPSVHDVWNAEYEAGKDAGAGGTIAKVAAGARMIHVSPTEQRDAIQQGGLDPTLSRDGYTYLFDDHDIGREEAYNFGEPGDAWYVETSGLNLEPYDDYMEGDPFDETVAYRTQDLIGPERLQYLGPVADAW